MPNQLSIESRINAFAQLGLIMGRAAESLQKQNSDLENDFPALYNAIQSAMQSNRWFTITEIYSAFKAWSNVLTYESLKTWIDSYKPNNENLKLIAVIMAGNIPIVGFHDFLCVLSSGNRFLGKHSSDDKILLPALAELLCSIEPGFKSRIQFKEFLLEGFDAIIATGSNNSARYFEYYFSKYPHIIRKNRNGIAILSGTESDTEMLKLGSDICSYFGLGCRNVSKIYIPEGYSPESIYKAIEPHIEYFNSHNKYMNNYTYQRSILLLNNTPHFDNGVLILKQSAQYSSPIATVHYEYYDHIETLISKLETDKEMIQCIVNEMYNNAMTVRFGETQNPGLNDYADGIDIMHFLNEV